MEAVNPFLTLEVDEAATPAEIHSAHRRLSRQWHPDRFADASPEEQAEAAERMVAINHAHDLLTRPEVAQAQRRKVAKARAAGHHVEPAPQRSPGESEVVELASGSRSGAERRPGRGGLAPAPWPR